MNLLLQRGIALARAGKRIEARAILLEAIEADERNEQAWLWLSGVVDAPEDMRVCLENVLALNPDNPQARQGLEWLTAQYGLEEEPIPTDIQTTLPSAEPEPAPVLRVAEVSLAAAVQTEPDNPCPYCGAPAAIGQRNCLKCRNTLMVRDQPNAKRSLWLGMLGGLRFFDAAISILIGLGLLVYAVMTYQTGQTTGGRAIADANRAAIAITTGAAVVLVLAGTLFAIGRSLLQREVWAYYVTIGLAVFSLGVLLVPAGMSSLLTGAVILLGQEQEVLAKTIGAVYGIGFVLQILYLGVAAASYRDFFGPMRRFQPSFSRVEPASHYNNGVAYKNRGMWYMAMREWEQAVARAPFDLNYLHGLGLAYAQLERFDQARSMLDKALQIAPAHRQISESRAVVERMAATGVGKN